MDDPGPSTAYYHRFASRADGPVRPPAASSPPLLGETTDPQAFLDAHARDGLYAVLNVERSATAAEIRDQYRSLASVYHPDKQPDEAHRRAAHARFTALQRAYEVLTDDAQRTVYDLFGEEGLRTKWEVGPRNLTKAQMRAHFLGEDEIRQRMEAAALVNSKVGDGGWGSA
jgi:DnaJ family protein C protein 11